MELQIRKGAQGRTQRAERQVRQRAQGMEQKAEQIGQGKRIRVALMEHAGLIYAKNWLPLPCYTPQHPEELRDPGHG